MVISGVSGEGVRALLRQTFRDIKTQREAERTDFSTPPAWSPPD